METINDRISELISYLKLTPNSFAASLGIKGTVIYNIQKGRNKPSFDLILKIVEVFDVNANWLISGAGSIILNDASAVHQINTNVVHLNSENDITNDYISTSQNKLNELLKSNFEYIDHQLNDILFHLKLLREKLNGVKFNKKEYQASQTRIKNITNVLKAVVADKNGGVSIEVLVNNLHQTDVAIKIYLDEIREVSRELYMHNYLGE